MSDLADNLRGRANLQADMALEIRDADDYATNTDKQALFVVSKVTANVFTGLADTVAFLEGASKIDEAHTRREQIMERTNAIRTAAAAGKWEDFDRLVNEFADPGSGGTPG